MNSIGQEQLDTPEGNGTGVHTPLAPEHVVAAVALGLVLTCAAIIQFLAAPGAHDFASFHRSAVAYVAGGSVYNADTFRQGAVGKFVPKIHGVERPNLNPPTLVLITSWMGHLPISVAALIWALLGVISLSASVAVLRDELALPRPQLIVALSGLLVLPGATAAWAGGQVTWFLLYPMTCAWRSYRHGQLVTAGLWMIPVVAIKPFFALAVLPLGLVMTAVSGFGAATVTGVSIAVTGWQAWAEWFALSDAVRWLSSPANASALGLITRLMGFGPVSAVGLNELPPAVLGLLGLLAAMVFAAAYRIPRTQPDAKWFAACAGALLLAPLAWLYYIPLLAGPAIAWYAARPRPTAMTAVCVAQWVPLAVAVLLIQPQWLFATAGSVHNWSLLCLWAIVAWEGVAAHR